MRQRITSAAMLTLIITSMAMSQFNVHVAKASGTIYIRADGKIDPPEASITNLDNITYTLNNDLSQSITIERDNIVIDGGGHTIQGPGNGTGIYLSGRNNITIKNTKIKQFETGILLWHSSNSNITENEATSNNYDGIDIWDSPNNILAGNNVTSNSVHGIYILESSNNTITGNTATANNQFGITIATSANNILTDNNITANNNDGITISASTNTTLTRNLMTNNSYNFGIYGYSLSDFTHSIDTTNLVNGKPIYYLTNETDSPITPETHPETGYLALISCTNLTVERLNIADNINGLLLANTNNSKILTNNITNNRYGIYSWSSKNNRIYHNNLINNTQQTYAERSTSLWNDTYPSGGNYWSDYNGTDSHHGPNQDLLGSDGIGDTQYNVDQNNRDPYPLTRPWNSVPVYNLNSGAGYEKIQETINANETTDGNTLFIKTGTYHENIIVNKTLSLIGEEQETTIIDGSGLETVVEVTASNVFILRFTLQNTRMEQNDSGILLYNNSGNNVFAENKIINCYHGILLWDSSGNNLINDNIITNNTLGILSSNTTQDTIADNDVTNNEEGIWLAETTNTTVIQNNITNNHLHGIKIDSGNNTIYHNSLINNTISPSADNSSTNTWNTYYPSGGNYWSNYNGTDSYSGKDQNETGTDGIGDTPHIINENNVDSYPLMNPYSPNLQATNLTASKTVVGQGFTLTLNATARNTSNKTELLNITLYANTTAITTFTNITLTSGNSTTITFTWNTTDFPKGSYTISAYAVQAEGEKETADNTFVYGTVKVTIPGDCSGDFAVRPYDLALLISSYGSTPDKAKWKPNCDIDDSKKVDPHDLALLIAHYGQHYP